MSMKERIEEAKHRIETLLLNVVLENVQGTTSAWPFIGYSGGKDSDTILCLVTEVLNNFEAEKVRAFLLRKNISSYDDLLLSNIYIRWNHLKDNMIVVHNPKMNTHPHTNQRLKDVAKELPHFHYVDSSQMTKFLEAHGLTVQFDGTRRDEYGRSNGKSTDLIVAGQSINRADMVAYYPDGLNGIAMSYPIYDWSDSDVFQFLAVRRIPISLEYEEV